MRSIFVLFYLLFDSSAAFKKVYTYNINGKIYHETVEQPWYRVDHAKHEKVPATDRERSNFGVHTVPAFASGDIPQWTELENRTFHCVDLICACDFFNGRPLSGSFLDRTVCVLPTGEKLGKAMRKEIRMMSDEERMIIEKALNDMKKDGTYNRLSRFHKHYGVHSGPAFTVWHRELLKRFEMTVRKYSPAPHSIGIPYWDTTLDSYLPDPKDSIMFTPTFLGTTDSEGHVDTGPYANWTTMEGLPYITRKIESDPSGEFLTPARVDWIIGQDDVNNVLAATLPLSTCTTHKMDDRYLEYSHDYVHFYISGDMGRSWSSSNDVIFLYHHSMIDLIFELFRQRAQTRKQRETLYPATNPECFPERHNADAFMPGLEPIRNLDGLSNGYTDNMFEFAPRPTCNEQTRDCGSKYLYCHLHPEDGPVCMSKVRPGGNCTGFDGTNVCYEQECVRGRCQEVFRERYQKKHIRPEKEQFRKRMGKFMNM